MMPSKRAASRSTRVGTLPRRGSKRKSGRWAMSWLMRRGLEVARVAPAGSWARGRPCRLTSTSRGSSRAATDMARSPARRSDCTSLKEQVAISTSPRSTASSRAVLKMPLSTSLPHFHDRFFLEPVPVGDDLDDLEPQVRPGGLHGGDDGLGLVHGQGAAPGAHAQGVPCTHRLLLVMDEHWVN